MSLVLMFIVVGQLGQKFHVKPLSYWPENHAHVYTTVINVSQNLDIPTKGFHGPSPPEHDLYQNRLGCIFRPVGRTHANLMAQLLCNLIRGQYVLNAQPAFMPKDIYIFSDGPKYAP